MIDLVSLWVRDLLEGKRHVLWLNNLLGVPKSPRMDDQGFLGFRVWFVAIVFVSEWQKRGYEEHYGINFASQVVVLQNAIVPFDSTSVAKS